MGQCLGITKSGSPCRARPEKDALYCAFHDPAAAERQRIARLKGSITGKKTPSIDTIRRWAKETKGDPDSLGDLHVGLSIGVIQGKVKPAVLNSVTRAMKILEWLSHMEEA